jgi:hypothetical protein
MPIIQNIMVEDAELPMTLPAVIDGLGQASGSDPVFIPTHIAGLAIWLRADMGITIATGVSQWNDQSGVGDSNRNAVQATGANQPTYNATDAAYNNQSTLSFVTASALYMQTGTWSHAASQPFTWIVVGNATSGGGGQQGFIDGITTQECRIFTNPNGSILDIYAGATLATTVHCTSPTIIGAIFNATNSFLYANNTQVAIAAGSAGASAQNPIGISIGVEYNISSYLNGKIAEVIGYYGVLSTAQLSLLFTYLGNRYGITVVV